LNEANDKLVLDTELALNADIAKVTGKTIGTVSGLEYSYTHASTSLSLARTRFKEITNWVKIGFC
jgi:hypothetical protein